MLSTGPRRAFGEGRLHCPSLSTLLRCATLAALIAMRGAWRCAAEDGRSWLRMASLARPLRGKLRHGDLRRLVRRQLHGPGARHQPGDAVHLGLRGRLSRGHHGVAADRHALVRGSTSSPRSASASAAASRTRPRSGAAFFFRYRGFPWDRYVVTTAAISTGFNYASEISDKEQDRAKDGEGSQLMHFFSPEITFAAPRHPQYELLFRFHHRSGVFGLVSDAWGGAQYGTIGLRWRF